MGGITGLEEYEAPQKYLDASAAYRFSKYAQLFVDATNLTNEYQRFYLVWPDQCGALELLRTHVHGRRPRAVVIGVSGAADVSAIRACPHSAP